MSLLELLLCFAFYDSVFVGCPSQYVIACHSLFLSVSDSQKKVLFVYFIGNIQKLWHEEDGLAIYMF